MPKRSPARRPYRSSLRRARARQTRQAIARAALKVFRKRGYRGGTIEAIAHLASVSPETVYATFGSKREILHHLIDVSLGGDEQPVKVIDRPEPRSILRETDPHRLLAGFAQGISGILQRAAPVFAILAEAAETVPELADLRAKLLVERLENMRLVARTVGRLTPLRVEEGPAAEDLWALTSPELFSLLTGDLHWTREKYAAWLEERLAVLLLRGESGKPSGGEAGPIAAAMEGRSS